MKKGKLIVPIVFDLLDYHIERPALTWVFEMYTNYCINNNTAIIAQEDYFKQKINTLDKIYREALNDEHLQAETNGKKLKFTKYQITNQETYKINNGKKASFKDQVYFMSHPNLIYEQIINEKLNDIERDYKQKIDAILTWYWNPTLGKIAKDRDIVLISQEISPVRDLFSKNYRMTLSYFQFFNKFDKHYCKDLYDQFLQESKKHNLKMLSRDELLALLLNTEDLELIKDYQNPEQYELGFSPPFNNDYFFEIYKNSTLQDTINSIEKIFNPNRVSIRNRINTSDRIGNPLWDWDHSEKSIFWIVKCKRVLTYVSNIVFDAMLFGKTTYLLSNNMPFSFKSHTSLKYKEESVVDSEYLNFMIFGYFVPWDLMLNQEYIEWRLTNPPIVEIYSKNQNYIFKKLGIDKLKEISLENILKTTHKIHNNRIKDILDYSGFYSLKKLSSTLDVQNKKLDESKELLQKEITKSLLSINIQQELHEFRELKQTRIWKSLTIYRKLKKYSKNFFINIFKDGPKTTFKRIYQRISKIIKYKKQREIEQDRYKYWIENHEISRKRKREINKELKTLNYLPLFSIIMPVYNVDLKWIRKAVSSINNQIYKNWELCIADDASTNPKLIKYLKRLSRRKNIKVTFRRRNGHISQASNSALKLANGEFVALMDNDDILHPQALAEVVKVLNEDKNTDLIYSDEDKVDIEDKRMEPFFKPDWTPDLFMSTNYLCHLTVIRKRLVDSVKGFRKGYEGSQDYDLFLRVIEKTKNIKHIPDVLYSWRKIPGSTAYEYKEKNYVDNRSIKALEDYLKRNNIKGEVNTGLFSGSFRVKYEIIGEPLVSILIPTKDKPEYIERCISSILDKTTYQNYEIIIIDTNSTDKKTLEYYNTIKDDPKIKFLKWEKKFNFSAVNNFGVKDANGEFLLLLNNDTEIITPTWIEGMLEHAQRKDVGAVGVKLLYPNNTIQHAGIVLGINGGTGKGVAGHAFKFFPREIQGFPVQKDIIKNYSAVTAACLMIKKDKYFEVGKMDEEFRIAFNDVDFGLKLLKKGYYNLYTPYVELFHHESISVGKPEDNTRDNDEFKKEIDMMYERWEELIKKDPYYNRNLTLTSEDFSIKNM